MVDLWHATPDLVAEPHARSACERVLSPGERNHLASLRLPRVARQYLVTRALVRAALSRRRGMRPEDWRFRSNPWGRPEPDPPCGLRFSVSHCEGLVVCAVTERRDVGVDVEPLSRGDAILEMAEHVFVDEERRALERMTERGALRSRATLLWTLKESYLKARGVGLSVSPTSFGFRFGDSGPVLIGPSSDAGTWRFRARCFRAFAVAVAIHEEAPEALGAEARRQVDGEARRC